MSMSINNLNPSNLNCKNINIVAITLKLNKLLDSYDGNNLDAKRKLHNIITLLIQHSAKENYIYSLSIIFEKLINKEKDGSYSVNKNSIINTIIFIIDNIYFLKKKRDMFIENLVFMRVIMTAQKYQDYAEKIEGITPKIIPANVAKNKLPPPPRPPSPAPPLPPKRSSTPPPSLPPSNSNNNNNNNNNNSFNSNRNSFNSNRNSNNNNNNSNSNYNNDDISENGNSNNDIETIGSGVTNENGEGNPIPEPRPPPPPPPVPAPPEPRPVPLNIYKKMLKVGLSKGDVRHKMKKNGISNNNIKNLIPENNTSPTPENSPEQKQARANERANERAKKQKRIENAKTSSKIINGMLDMAKVIGEAKNKKEKTQNENENKHEWE